MGYPLKSLGTNTVHYIPAHNSCTATKTNLQYIVSQTKHNVFSYFYPHTISTASNETHKSPVMVPLNFFVRGNIHCLFVHLFVEV